MAARKEIAEKKQALVMSLRHSSQNGSLVAGDMLPTVRELAREYELSVRVVAVELQKLVDDGVLHTVPRVGTFVGRAAAAGSDIYLLLLPQDLHASTTIRQVQIGFEERVAELGGASLVMSITAALVHRQRGELPPLSGVFDYAYHPTSKLRWGGMPHVPTVGFATPGADIMLEDTMHTDTVHFDDVDGGRQAAQHMVRLGHSRIAFLGLHDATRPSGFYLWSVQRHNGWCDMMERAGLSVQGLSFLPPSEPVQCSHDQNSSGEIRVAAEAASRLVARPDITAVVAANDYAALGLFEALRGAHIPAAHWPSVIGFDDLPRTDSHVLTSLRLPWEGVGKAAVDLLWERRSGRLTGPPQDRAVKMRLISRLTSRKDWSHGTSHACLAPSHSVT